MPSSSLAAAAAVAVRAYRALCRKHLAPPRAEAANTCPRNLQEHDGDDARAGRP